MLRLPISSGLISALLLVTLYAWPGSVEARQKEADFRELERVALEELKENKVPGAAVAVVFGDRVVFAKGFGVASVETGAPVTTDMLFRIGSTTKMLTAAALVKLADEGKIEFDKPIGGYAKGLNPKLSQVTLHQLLSHTAGIRDDGAGPGPLHDSALAERVRAWKEDYFFTAPGKIYSYSSPGYWLAGYVIEEVGGGPYADQMVKLIFDPVGMKSTTLRPTMAMTRPLSQGHEAAPGATNEQPAVVRPLVENTSALPGGSVFTSANDFARFAIALLNEGRIDGKQVLPASMLKTLTGPHALIPMDSNYGYGLVLYNDRGVRVAQHGGARKGYGALVLMVPEHRFAVIILANKTAAMLQKTAEKAMELVVPLKAKTEEKPTPALALSDEEMDKYTGVYVNGPQRWEVSVEAGKLLLKQETTLMPLSKIGDRRFLIGAPGGGELVFVPSAAGTIEYLHLGLYAAKKVQPIK